MGLLAALLGTISISGQVNGNIYSGENSRIEALGACSITPEATSCWDMNARPNAQLTDRVEALVSSAPYPGTFKFGRKNRYLVVDMKSPHGLSTTGPTKMEFFSGEASETLRLFRVVAERDQRQAPLRMTLTGIPGPPAITMPLRAGAKSSYAGSDAEFGPITPFVPDNIPGPFFMGLIDPWLNYYPRLIWRMPIGFWNSTTAPLTLKLTPFDRSGKPILYVDLDGRPATERQFRQENPKGYFEWKPNAVPRFRPASFRATIEAGATAGMGYTNIDPKHIPTVTVQLLYSKPVVIEAFPLDPTS
ncbi:MAG: hypothetical protein ACAH95_09535 [Fimbriimonas sp.]